MEPCELRRDDHVHRLQTERNGDESLRRHPLDPDVVAVGKQAEHDGERKPQAGAHDLESKAARTAPHELGAKPLTREQPAKASPACLIHGARGADDVVHARRRSPGAAPSILPHSPTGACSPAGRRARRLSAPVSRDAADVLVAPPRGRQPTPPDFTAGRDGAEPVIVFPPEPQHVIDRAPRRPQGLTVDLHDH